MMVAMALPTLQVGERVLSSQSGLTYVVVDAIGRGGFGAAYEAFVVEQPDVAV